MGKVKENLLKIMRQRSDARAAQLTGAYLKAKPDQKEALMAGILVEKWLSNLCDDCME